MLRWLSLVIWLPLCGQINAQWAVYSGLMYDNVGYDSCADPSGNSIWIDPLGYIDLTLSYFGAGGESCSDRNTDGSVKQTLTTHYVGSQMIAKSFNFTFGTVTFRERGSNAQTWAIVWLLGANCQGTYPFTQANGYSPCPAQSAAGYIEIDITEFLASTSQYLPVIHNAGTNNYCAAVTQDNTQWHIYTTTWSSTAVNFYVDGTLKCTLTTVVPQLAMFPIVTMLHPSAMNTMLPSTMNVDYIRICSDIVATGCTLTDANLIFDDEFTPISTQTQGAAVRSGGMVK